MHRIAGVSSTVHRLVVIGQPVPQGSKKYMGHTKSINGKRGRAILRESAGDKLDWWRRVVTAEAYNTKVKLSGALRVEMHFTMPKPKSAPKKKRTWPATRPDVSKLVRAVEDSLVDAGFMEDDSRIIRLVTGKYYPNEGTEALDVPGVVIYAQEITEEDEAHRDSQQRLQRLTLSGARSLFPF